MACLKSKRVWIKFKLNYFPYPGLNPLDGQFKNYRLIPTAKILINSFLGLRRGKEFYVEGKQFANRVPPRIVSKIKKLIFSTRTSINAKFKIISPDLFP